MLKGNNFFQQVIPGVALATQTVNNTTVNGATIAEPWKYGRQVAFLWVGGAFAASSSGRLRLQGQKISDSAWENLKENDGTTDLEFTATDFDDAGAAESGVLLGTVDVSRLDSTVYKAIRVTFESEGAQDILGGVAYLITDLYNHPSGTADQLFSKTVPA